MQIINLIQGTPEWHAHRAQHFNASDAPAMLGVSKYKTRTQLLDEMKSGIVKDVDAATQRRFNDGHAFEALARPLAEEIIGQELYPVTGVEGQYSASFDGLTMDETINFEHKSLNDEIRACKTAADLDEMYRVQMEQQMMIAGSIKTLFMASKWNGEQLVEKREFWYESDPALRQKIIQGWEQFAKDLAAHKPKAIKEAPKAEVIEALPAIHVQIKGEVMASNMNEYKLVAVDYIRSISTDLKDDQDFANAEQAVKFCKECEDKLEAARESALAQTASIDDLMKTIDYIKDNFRAKRLELDKLVKERKEAIKAEIVNQARAQFDECVRSLEKEIAPIRLIVPAPKFAEAAKNKRTLASLHDAIDTETAAAEMEAFRIAALVRGNLNASNDIRKDYGFLFSDLQAIVYKPLDDFNLLVASRVNEHKQAEAQRIESERERIRIEEERKAAVKIAAIPERVATAQAVVTAAPGAITNMDAAIAGDMETVRGGLPSDDEIICHLAAYYGVHKAEVIDRLCSMDLAERI